MYYKNIFF